MYVIMVFASGGSSLVVSDDDTDLSKSIRCEFMSPKSINLKKCAGSCGQLATLLQSFRINGNK